MRRRRDPYTELAKELGLRSRAYFKLKDLDERYDLLEPGDIVIDVGAAPGGWMKYVLKKIGFDGKVIGIDIRPIEDFEEPNAYIIVGDILEPEIFKKIAEVLGEEKATVVISDASPNITGVYEVDTERIFDLNKRVLEIVDRFLARGGKAVIKTFQGRHEKRLHDLMKRRFRVIKKYKPRISRKHSSEIYYLGFRYRG